MYIYVYWCITVYMFTREILCVETNLHIDESATLKCKIIKHLFVTYIIHLYYLRYPNMYCTYLRSYRLSPLVCATELTVGRLAN